MTRKADLRTLAVSAGRADRVPGGPLSVPPVLGSALHSDGYRPYGRDGSPTWEALEEAVGALEGGESVAFASGMGAIAAVFEHLPAGSRVVMPADAYFEARRFVEGREELGHLELKTFDPWDESSLAEALREADLLWLESISNPLLEVCDLERVIPPAREAGATVVVDATLASPALQRPLALGADVVLHSATKFISGHSDALLGVASSRDSARAQRLRDARAALGATPGALEAYLGLRGLRTLPLRVAAMQKTALDIATRLEAHPAVTRVLYPGLPSHPSRAVAGRVLDGPGAVLAFDVEGGPEAARTVCDSVRVFTHATSFGGVESLIECRTGLLRAGIGCEHPDDLWADLVQALDRVSARSLIA